MDIEIPNKWVVFNDDYFYLGKAQYHKQLVKTRGYTDDDCLGGGWWIKIDKDLILYSSSDQYGYAKKELFDQHGITEEVISIAKKLRCDRVIFSDTSTIELAIERGTVIYENF
jgi:hypothetical protein